MDESNFEEVSTSVVMNGCHDIYTAMITALDNFNKLISCVDPAKTLIFLVAAHLILLQILLTNSSLSTIVWTIYIAH